MKKPNTNTVSSRPPLGEAAQMFADGRLSRRRYLANVAIAAAKREITADQVKSMVGGQPVDRGVQSPAEQTSAQSVDGEWSPTAGLDDAPRPRELDSRERQLPIGDR